MIGIRASNAFDDVQSIRVIVAGAIEEAHVHRALLVQRADSAAHEPSRIDDQRLAVPFAVRPSHPRVGRRPRRTVDVDRTDGTGELRHHQDGVGRLHDLHGIRHVHHARHAGQITLHFGVLAQRVGGVLPFHRKGVRLVRNRAVHDHTCAWRNRVGCAELQDRTRSRFMRLEIPVGRVERLPEPVEIRLSARRARSPVRWRT